MPRNCILHAALLPCFVFGLLTLTACEAPQPTAGLADAVAAYRSGQYQQAYDQSIIIAKQRRANIDQAKYMAGMSAYQLGRDDEAMKYLLQLVSHSRDEIAGPSGATVGLLHAKYKRHERALAQFEKAVPKLSGNDQANAYFHMAITLQKLGRYPEAQPILILAASKATDPDLKAAANHRMQTSGFTLQFGAYSQQSIAATRARDVGPLTRRTGIGTPTISTKTRHGTKLYLVHCGRYATYQLAQTARQKLGLSDIVVVELTE